MRHHMWLVWLASLVLALGLGVAAGITYVWQSYAVYPASHSVQEDEPGWDCLTMGNHLCGPTGGE